MACIFITFCAGIFRQRVVKRKVKQSRWFMSGSRNFRQGGGGGWGWGGPGQSDKKALTFSFAFFLVLSLSISKQYIIFQGFRGGLTFSRGVQLFPGGGGVQLLIPYRNPYNL